MLKELAGGTASNLTEILALREERAAEITRLNQLYRCEVICFKLNLAGRVKNFPLAEKFFALGVRQIAQALAVNHLDCLYKSLQPDKRGDTAYFAVPCAPDELKKRMCEIEDGSAWGRLYDIDVYTTAGSDFSRRELRLAARGCLLCSEAAHTCARNQTHDLKTLLTKTLLLMQKGLEQNFADSIREATLAAMLKELSTTPKPGLIDRNNCGAHYDMDYQSFSKSAAAIAPYFAQIALQGLEFSGNPDEMLKALRPLGYAAEAAMYHATGGVNTHKGLIFSFGIICAAAAKLYRANQPLTPDNLLHTSALIAAPVLDERGALCDTNGQKIFRRHHLSGVRGEAAAGFPVVRQIGLGVLRRALEEGISENDAGVFTLIHLMAHLDDTNIISRSDLETLKLIQTRARNLLEKKLPLPSFLREVSRMDQDFIEAHISPGGCADMLALCWLIHLLSKSP